MDRLQTDNEIFVDIRKKVIGKEVIIWGAGTVGINAWCILSKINIRVNYFIDMNAKRIGEKIGNTYIMPMEFLEGMDKQRIFVFVCTGEENANDIRQILHNKGVCDDNISLSLSTERYSKLDCIDMMLGYSRKRAIIDMMDSFTGDKESIHPPQEDSYRKIVTLGSSTTDWSFYGICSWPYYLQNELINKHYAIRVLNAGVIGFQVFQELLILIRDIIPRIKPDIVISYSGLNDAQIKNYPWKSQAYYNRVKKMDSCAGGGDTEIYLGPEADSVDVWLYCQKCMHALCLDNGIRYFGILEPTMVSGRYKMTDLDVELTSNQYNRDYIERYCQFISNVLLKINAIPYLYDFTSIFDEQTDCFIEWRHCNEKGNKIVANEVLKVILPYL